jgi:hypothetical protein
MFVLQPKPTFKVDVSIPTTDGDAIIEFEFKHKGVKALKAFYDSLSDGDTVRNDVDALGELVAGWAKVDTKFSSEALEQLLDNYPGSAKAIFEAYNKGLVEGKRKNS